MCINEGVSEGSGHERRGIINPATYSAGALFFPLENINIPTSLSLLVSQPVPTSLSVASSAIPLTPPSTPVSSSLAPTSLPNPDSPSSSSFSLAVYNAGILVLSAAYRNIAEYFLKMNLPFTRQHLITHFPHLLKEYDIDYQHGNSVYCTLRRDLESGISLSSPAPPVLNPPISAASGILAAKSGLLAVCSSYTVGSSVVTSQATVVPEGFGVIRSSAAPVSVGSGGGSQYSV